MAEYVPEEHGGFSVGVPAAVAVVTLALVVGLVAFLLLTWGRSRRA